MLYLVCSSAGLCVRLAEAPATAVCGATAANTKGNKGAGACCTAAVHHTQKTTFSSRPSASRKLSIHLPLTNDCVTHCNILSWP